MSDCFAQKKSTFRRKGPSPLPLNLCLAMMEYRFLMEKGMLTQHQLEGMVDGIRKYYNYPFSRPDPGYACLYTAGEVGLLRRKGAARGRTILLIPSLINRASILDLLPGHSFMESLEAKGFGPVLLDWGDPRADPSLVTIDQLIMERLEPALAFLAEREGRPIPVIGYCMGGLLLTAMACRRNDLLEKLALIGTPWDFHAQGGMLPYVAAGTPAAFQSMAERGYLPMAWIQSAFAMMNADRASAKFADFKAEQDEEREKLFVAVEDWLNDGVDLPASLARTCITEWYGENRPGAGQWTVGGKAVQPQNLNVPVLIVAAQRDRLVPPGSSLALLPSLQHGTSLIPDLGHIGMMAGRRARHEVWEPVAAWLNHS